jgi:hypothetical protein
VKSIDKGFSSLLFYTKNRIDPEKYDLVFDYGSIFQGPLIKEKYIWTFAE